MKSKKKVVILTESQVKSLIENLKMNMDINLQRGNNFSRVSE
jgi:hypothetical protein